MTQNLTYLWQHLPSNMSPYIFKLGQFEIRYYGLMYIAAFFTVYLLSVYRLKTEDFDYTREDIENYLTWAIIGLLLGARVGYVLFYNLGYYMENPAEIFLPFTFKNGFHFTGLAGMSYHGGLIGVITSTFLFCRKYSVDLWAFTEFIVPSIPLGYTFGRIGNFINGELYGRATTVSWGMYFPQDMTRMLRHPSQLYEAFFEGIFIFIILWGTRKTRQFSGFALSLYLIGYGTARFFIEFVREPDVQLGLFIEFFSMGQLLCLSMIAAGILLFYIRKRQTRQHML